MSTAAGRSQGRPPATDHAAIEEAAFRLFEEHGFEATTIDDIAAAVGVGRRTLFRYYPSKNDIPWGQFDASLVHLRAFLAATPEDVPVREAVRRAVLDFNRLDEDAIPQHRQRMRLLLTTPALQAHSALRYREWRRCIAAYVAQRYGLAEDDLLPRTIGRVTLALALSAYEQWLDDETASLSDLIDASVAALATFMTDDGPD